MTRVVPISALLLGLFRAVSCGSPRGGGVAEFYPASFEAGSVGYADRVMARATMRNVGNGVLNIQNIRRNCACYLVSVPGKSIRLDGETSTRRVPVVSLQPGESVTLEFDLTFPKDKTPRSAIFYVLSDDVQQRLRTFTIRLSVSEEPCFSVAGADEIVLQLPRGEEGAQASLQRLNSRLGVVKVEERPHSGEQKRYAFRFGKGANLEKVARTYVEHPGVNLIFLRASETKVAQAQAVIAGPPDSVAPYPVPRTSLRKRLDSG